MVKKGRHRRGGRTTPRRPHPDWDHPHPGVDVSSAQDEPDLMADLRLALDGEPLEFLGLMSSLLAAMEPDVDPFGQRPARAAPDRSTLLAAFMEVDRPETTALLTAFAAMGTDEMERRRLGRVVAARGHALPVWLEGLAQAEAYRAVELTHVLHDGDDVFVGVRLVTGDELTVVVYIDHNLGTLVKDAFVVPEAIAATLRSIEERLDADSTVAELPLADAKARILDAIATGAITYPPFETDTWPACRPLVEWVARLLPDGGRLAERPEWDEPSREALLEQFFASSFGRPLDDADHRGLVESILWFGCDYGPGDPLRWSPVAVEILLGDWVPRKIVADADYLAKAPAVLRGFIRFCHAERGIPARLTAQTLDAVDLWEPDYQEAIRSPRPQGPAALLAAMGVLDPDGPWDIAGVEGGQHPRVEPVTMRSLLEHAVGGPDALAALDEDPLPDEPFDWSGIPDAVHDPVAAVLRLTDGCCDELLDLEHRTAARRVLARIAATGAEVFQRRGRTESAAAAICWCVCRANDTFDQRQGGLTQKALVEHFGIKGGSGNIANRAATLLAAGGFHVPSSAGSPNDLALGSPDFLVASRRRTILRRRALLDREA